MLYAKQISDSSSDQVLGTAKKSGGYVGYYEEPGITYTCDIDEPHAHLTRYEAEDCIARQAARQAIRRAR